MQHIASFLFVLNVDMPGHKLDKPSLYCVVGSKNHTRCNWHATLNSVRIPEFLNRNPYIFDTAAIKSSGSVILVKLLLFTSISLDKLKGGCCYFTPHKQSSKATTFIKNYRKNQFLEMMLPNFKFLTFQIIPKRNSYVF